MLVRRLVSFLTLFGTIPHHDDSTMYACTVRGFGTVDIDRKVSRYLGMFYIVLQTILLFPIALTSIDKTQLNLALLLSMETGESTLYNKGLT